MILATIDVLCGPFNALLHTAMPPLTPHTARAIFCRTGRADERARDLGAGCRVCVLFTATFSDSFFSGSLKKRFLTRIIPHTSPQPDAKIQMGNYEITIFFSFSKAELVSE